jgi:hypothetical protein
VPNPDPRRGLDLDARLMAQFPHRPRAERDVGAVQAPRDAQRRGPRLPHLADPGQNAAQRLQPFQREPIILIF